MKSLLMTLALLATQAHASEGMFGYLYTLDNTPKTSWEFEQKQTYRTGKAQGSYNAIDFKTGFEYGITNDLQVAFYLNSQYLSQQGVPNTDAIFEQVDMNEYNITGASVEFIYRILSPYKDGIGLGIMAEPEMSVRQAVHGTDTIERGIEWRLILQKNFLDDTLITTYNLMVLPEWVKEDGMHEKELYVEHTAGVTYRFAPNWFAGLEFRNHREFPHMNLGGEEHSAWFAGPNVHYANQSFWATLTVLPQIFGQPTYLGDDQNGDAIGDRRLHLNEHERLEVRFMVGIPLGGGHSHEH